MKGSYQAANEWLEAHPLLWFVLAAVVPGLTYIGAQIVIGGESFATAAPLGAAFGLAFAVITVLGNWFFSD
ncbi:hypothetical protein BBD46_02550 [Natrialba sp. SSL1]|nr:hypothetical protein BBD46_02550 [Natrialba sp. SSL1]